jgi:hypothetical protein
MNPDFEARAIAALEALEQGESVDAILQRFPEDAPALRPLLEVARDLQALPAGYSVFAQATSRSRMLQEAQRLRQQRSSTTTFLPALRRLSLAFAALALLVLVGAGLLAGPAASALPGDSLYPVKRAGEGLQLLLAPDTTALQARLQQERRRELLVLLAEGREAEVDCAGTIAAITGDRWQLDDLTLWLVAESEIDGVPAIGAEVEGRCLARDGRLYAGSLRVTGGSAPPPTVTPSPTPSPTGTPTGTPTPTPTLEPGTMMPGPTATLTPPGDDDDDDGEDDDNSGPGSGEGDDDGEDDEGDDDSNEGGDDVCGDDGDDEPGDG